MALLYGFALSALGESYCVLVLLLGSLTAATGPVLLVWVSPACCVDAVGLVAAGSPLGHLQTQLWGPAKI